MIELTDVALKNIGEKYSLKQVIFEDFKKDLSITGGWGYSFKDAIIVENNNYEADRNTTSDAIGIEYYIVEKRLYEELIIFRQPPNQYSDINWKLQIQKLYSEQDKKYDYLQFEVNCFKESDWEKLKAEYESGRTNPTFNKMEHEKHREELMCHFVTEYYFDITAFIK